MAEDKGYDIGGTTEMDYAEHEKTYGLFLAMFKYGTIWVIAILLGMMVALVASGGFFGGILIFLVFGVVVTFLMR